MNINVYEDIIEIQNDLQVQNFKINLSTPFCCKKIINIFNIELFRDF